MLGLDRWPNSGVIYNDHMSGQALPIKGAQCVDLKALTIQGHCGSTILLDYSPCYSHHQMMGVLWLRLLEYMTIMKEAYHLIRKVWVLLGE